MRCHNFDGVRILQAVGVTDHEFAEKPKTTRGSRHDVLRLAAKHAVLFALLSVLLAPTGHAQHAKTLFDQFATRIYQVRIIARASGKQTGLGSGFIANEQGLLVSNYHVIADYAQRPQQFALEYLAHDGSSGDLVLVDLDVVNDLALLRLDNKPPDHLELADALPAHGERIYSIGNPHDLGWTVIPGTYNGITAHSVYERIHFSGSINPGMSGGPALDDDGHVIGVNVATAGNQLSFLVPLNRLSKFLRQQPAEALDLTTLDTYIAAQLVANQQQLIGGLLSAEWQSTPLGEAQIPSDMAPYLRCWGYSEDDPDVLYTHTGTSCSSEEQIYLSSDFTTGNIAVQFNWLDSARITNTRFYKLYKEKIANAYPDNEATKNDVSAYVCHEDFVGANNSAAVVTKTTFCAREYRKYRGLFDVLYFGATVHKENQALISHFTLAGVEQALAVDFLHKFIGSVRWR